MTIPERRHPCGFAVRAIALVLALVAIAKMATVEYLHQSAVKDAIVSAYAPVAAAACKAAQAHTDPLKPGPLWSQARVALQIGDRGSHRNTVAGRSARMDRALPQHLPRSRDVRHRPPAAAMTSCRAGPSFRPCDNAQESVTALFRHPPIAAIVARIDDSVRRNGCISGRRRHDQPQLR